MNFKKGGILYVMIWFGLLIWGGWIGEIGCNGDKVGWCI